MSKQKFQFQNFQRPKEEINNKNENISETTSESEAMNPPVVGSLLNRLNEEKEKNPSDVFNIKFIKRNLMKANEKNNYPKSKIEELKESILYFGLQDPIGVIYIREDNEYIIEAGHNRTYAIDELIKEFKNYPDKESEEYKLYLKNVELFEKRGYPCLVRDVLDEGVQYYYDDNTDLSEIPESVIDSEIRVIITNEIRREDSPSVKALNVARLSELYERKNVGKKRSEQININEKIASDLNISKRQVANYKSIGKLIPGLQKAFDENKISLKEGSSYAQLSEEEQEIILTMIDAGKKVSKEEVAVLKKEKQQLQDNLKNKEEELRELEKELREVNAENKKLETDKKNLTAELETKEAMPEPEPIYIPDPKMPEIEDKLKDKENEVKKLKEEIKNLKEQNSNKKKMNAEQSEVVKRDLALRNSYEDCKKAISKFLEYSDALMESYGKISAEDLKNMAIMSEIDIADKKKDLLNLFN